MNSNQNLLNAEMLEYVMNERHGIFFFENVL